MKFKYILIITICLLCNLKIVNANKIIEINPNYETKLLDSNTQEIYDFNNICTTNTNVLKVMKLIAVLIQVCRILAPLLIIGLGSIDFFKVMLSNDDKAMAKATTALIKRIIAGITVFIIPSLVLAFINIFDFTDGLENSSNFNNCTKCILNINLCEK